MKDMLKIDSLRLRIYFPKYCFINSSFTKDICSLRYTCTGVKIEIGFRKNEVIYIYGFKHLF